MSRTTAKSYFQENTLISADELVTLNNDIATQVSAFNSDNTQSEWVTVKHLKPSTSPIAPYVGYGAYQGTVTTTFSTGSYQDVTLNSGGNRMQLRPQLTLRKGDVMRLHGGAFVKEITFNDGALDYFWFRFLVHYKDDGAGEVNQQFGREYGYSQGQILREEWVAGVLTHELVQYSRCAFSHMYIHTKATDRHIIGVQLQIKLEDGSASVKLTQGHIGCVIMK